MLIHPSLQQEGSIFCSWDRNSIDMGVKKGGKTFPKAFNGMSHEYEVFMLSCHFLASLELHVIKCTLL